MAEVQTVAGAADRVMAALVAGLEIEFGRGAGEALAQRFLEAEESDFLWEARIDERWLGSFDRGETSEDDGEAELDRVAIFGRIDGAWFAATAIVDGDGEAHGLMGRRSFAQEVEARSAYRELW